GYEDGAFAEKTGRLLAPVEYGRVDPSRPVAHKFGGLNAIEDAFRRTVDKPRDRIRPPVRCG
ncbi:MAG: hypothetical protein GX558_08940, partial [Clostridiales bacterium]|nr:hypothetical protein [Clostridiales bacterium]